MKSNRQIIEDFLNRASEENLATVVAVLTHWAEKGGEQTLNEQVNLMQQEAAEVFLEVL